MRWIIKPEADVDYYAWFCTNVGDFLGGGPRGAWADQPWFLENEFAPERFDRADASGTSEYEDKEGGVWLGWDCTDIFLNRGTSEGWLLKRTDVREYVRRRSAGEPVEDLLTPSRDE